MKYYPICLEIKERKCLVVGGGRVAERKVRGLLDSGALVVVVSPALTDGLNALLKAGEISWHQRNYRKGDMTGHFLVMAATDDSQVQDQVQDEACRNNILLNIADVPEKCNFILPAQVKRGDLSIAISTSGNSPALAKKMRRLLEAQFTGEYETLNDIMGQIRPLVLERGLSQQENELIFNQILESDILAWIKDKNWPKIKTHLEKILGRKAELKFNNEKCWPSV